MRDDGADVWARLEAAKVLLDLGWGPKPQPQEVRYCMVREHQAM